MTVPTTIADISDPRIQFFKNLKGQHPRLTQSGLVLIEGEEQIRRAIHFDATIIKLFIEEEYLSIAELVPEATVYVAARETMEGIVGYRLHRGAMALASRPGEIPFFDLPLPAIALNEVTDPENVGAIARSAAAFGFKSLIVDSLSSDPFSRRAIRVSMGSVFALKIFVLDDFKTLNSSGIGSIRTRAKLIAIESGMQGSFPKNLVREGIYFFGNEKRGITQEILANMDDVVELPMESSELSSINVAASAAIVCYLVSACHGERILGQDND